MKMKKFAIILATLLISAALIVMFVGCDEPQQPAIEGGAFNYPTYPQGDSYTASSSGSEQRAVQGIDIEWLAGSVTVEESASATAITYVETAYENGVQIATESLETNRRMHFYLNGSVLMIKFAAAQNQQSMTFTKDLVVTVPTGTALNSIEIETASAAVKVGALTTRRLRIDSTSGNVESNAKAQNLSIDTASGNIKAAVTSPANDIEADSASGKIELTVSATANEVSADSASGDVTVTVGAGVGEVSCESMLGAVSLTLNATAREVDVETISGPIRMTVGALIGFRLETLSAFTLPAGVAQTGSTMDRVPVPIYTYLNGGAMIEVETTTGTFEMQIV